MGILQPGGTKTAGRHVLHIVGARPQFIKLAPVTQAFRELGIPSRVLHTGQHYDYTLSDAHFDALELPPPDYHLGIGSESHARQTARMLEAIEEVLAGENPGMVLVYGDTNSTLAGALAAAKMCIGVGHVEAGLRSFDRRMPEEINRIVTDHLSSCHFCPTANAVSLLAREGISGTLTGDVMYDALLQYSLKNAPHPYGHGFVLATIHRAQNTDDPARFKEIWDGLRLLAREMPVIFPVHPRTRNRYPDLISSEGSLTVTEPVDYLTMLSIIKDASCVVTDSGGVQKEAFLLKCPCVTVRDTTEWPETVLAGANRLVPADAREIAGTVSSMAGSVVTLEDNPFGDGRASFHIARLVRERLG